MSPVDARVSLLLAELERDWKAVLNQLDRAESVDPAAGDPDAALVALSLDHAYQAFETLLLRLERGLGLAERSGASWHGDLLEAAGLRLQGLRPPVYPEEARQHWRALLRFRHFLRHAYLVNLDPDQLEKNRDHLRAAARSTGAHVEALMAALLDENG